MNWIGRIGSMPRLDFFNTLRQQLINSIVVSNSILHHSHTFLATSGGDDDNCFRFDFPSDSIDKSEDPDSIDDDDDRDEVNVTGVALVNSAVTVAGDCGDALAFGCIVNIFLTVIFVSFPITKRNPQFHRHLSEKLRLKSLHYLQI